MAAPRGPPNPAHPANAIESLIWTESDIIEVDKYIQMQPSERLGAIITSGFEIERMWKKHGVRFCPPADVSIEPPPGAEFRLIDRSRDCVNSIVQSASVFLTNIEKRELSVQVAFFAHMQRILKIFQRAEEQKTKGQKSSQD